MSFTAKFPGNCSCCGADIKEGQMIESSPYGGYQHVSCPATADQSKKSNEVSCPDCFLIHQSGHCDLD